MEQFLQEFQGGDDGAGVYRCEDEGVALERKKSRFAVYLVADEQEGGVDGAGEEGEMLR